MAMPRVTVALSPSLHGCVVSVRADTAPTSTPVSGTFTVAYSRRVAEGNTALVEPLFSGESWGSVVWTDAVAVAAEWVAGRMLGVREGQGGEREALVVVELGAGAGVPTLAGAMALSMSTRSRASGAERGRGVEAWVTDVRPWIDAARAAVDASAELSKACRDGWLHVAEFDWNEAPPERVARKANVVVAVECVSRDVYGEASLVALVKAIDEVRSDSGGAELLLCSRRRPGDGLDDVLVRLHDELGAVTLSRNDDAGGEGFQPGERGVVLLHMRLPPRQYE